MSRIRIVKKNDEYTSEYQVGDLFEIQAPGMERPYYGKIRCACFSG